MKKINFKKDFNRMLTFKNKKKQSGFTFIELLVVMAILGILATVVYLSLKSLRVKGSDATIKADLEGVRKLAVQEFINLQGKYTINGSAFSCGPGGGTCSDCLSAGCNSYYAGTILANPSIQKPLSDIKGQNGGINPYVEINTSGTAYAIAVTLKTAGKYWCVDSTGAAKDYYGTTQTNYYSGQNGVNATQSGIWQGMYACN